MSIWRTLNRLTNGGITSGIINGIGEIKNSENKIEEINKDIEEKTQGLINGNTDWNDGTVIDQIGEKIQENKNTESESEKAAQESVLDTEETPNASNVDTEQIIASNEEMLKKYWEREDKIREETQKREDTAYQRAVNDMRKAGINPNLLGINPANSGGGITQSSRIEPTASAEISGLTSEIINAINNEIKIEENQKDRITDIIKTILGVGLIKLFK